MGRKVGLLVNTEKADAVEAATHVRALIDMHATLVGEQDALIDGPPHELDDADLIIVLGGDGTLLGQSRRCVELGVPLLGINAGKLGFMAEYDLESFERHARHLLGDGELLIRELPALRADVFGRGAKNARFTEIALNEAAVAAGPPFRMIELSIRIDGESGPLVRGDGIIVATPVGSTAYNLSAGGPILSPAVEGFAITPIAAHSLAFRPIIVGLSTVIELELERVNRDSCGGGTTLVLDGQVQEMLDLGERVVIRRHDEPVRFVKNPDGVFWRTLIEKLHWAARPRERNSGP